MKTKVANLKYCLPVVADSLADAIDDITSASREYQIIEVWLDYLSDLSKENLPTLLTAIGSATPLFLFRRQNLEPAKTSFEHRTGIIKALPAEAWLDFDIRTQPEEIAWCRQHRPELTLILSYHNYQETPEQSELEKLSNEMLEAGAAITKFSTFCRDERDALRLMSLLLDLKKANRRATVLGMGDHGRMTRIIGPLWGSEIAYAPQDVSKSSAPGQLSLKQLSAIFKEL